MAKKKVEIKKTETEIAEENLASTLGWCFEFVEAGGGYYESSTGSIQVNSERIVEQLRETVKCWVKDAIREMKEEETNG